MLKWILIRLLIGLEAGILLSIPLNELIFQNRGETLTRLPKTVVVTIPAGTAASVALGTDVLPENIAFVQGDHLEVRNQDSVVHTLGPMVIPAGNSARMELAEAGFTSYLCTFETGNYLGLQVQRALPWTKRLQWVLLAGIPLGVLIGLGSLVVKPRNNS